MRRNKPDAVWIADALVQGGPVRVGEPDLTDLVGALQRRHVRKGTLLYSPKRRPVGISIIRRGCVELSQGTGPDRRVVGILKSGDVVGDVSVLQDAPPPFTARAIQASELWFLDADDFRRLIATYPSLAIGWLCNLAARLSRSRTRVAETLGTGLPRRLARLLMREAVDGVIHLPQQTVAQMLGVQRTSVNRTLNEFERQGLISLGYGEIVLNDSEGLHDLASSEPLTEKDEDAA